MQPPGDKIPDKPFDEMAPEWQEFIRDNLIASPLYEQISSIPVDEYVSACLDMIELGLMKIEITEHGQFKISGAGIMHH